MVHHSKSKKLSTFFGLGQPRRLGPTEYQLEKGRTVSRVILGHELFSFDAVPKWVHSLRIELEILAAGPQLTLSSGSACQTGTECDAILAELTIDNGCSGRQRRSVAQSLPCFLPDWHRLSTESPTVPSSQNFEKENLPPRAIMAGPLPSFSFQEIV